MNLDELLKNFTNREIATYVWLLCFLVFISFYKSIRESLVAVLKSFFKVKIVIPFILMGTYYAGSLFILEKFKLWNVSMVKDATLWFVISGTVLLFDSATKSEEKDFFKKIVKDTLTFMVIFEFVINTYNFHLLVEFIFVPFVTLVIILREYSSRNEEYKIVEKVMNSIQIFIGLLIIFLSIYNYSNNMKGTTAQAQLTSFFFPILSTILLIPFAYLIALYSVYDNVFTRLSMRKEMTSIDLIRSKLLLMISYNLRLRKLQSFYKENAYNLMRVQNLTDLKKLLN